MDVPEGDVVSRNETADLEGGVMEDSQPESATHTNGIESVEGSAALLEEYKAGVIPGPGFLERLAGETSMWKISLTT